MTVYYLVFVTSFLLTGLDYVQHRFARMAVFILFCIPLVLLPGMRSIGVDNDSLNYQEIFNTFNSYPFIQILTGDYIDNIERGFALIMKLIGSLGGNVQTLFLVVAILTGVLNYSFIYKVSPLPFTSLLFYLSFFYLYRDFTQIRYGLSAAMIFWVTYFLVDKRYLIGTTLLLLAFFFHSSAVIILAVFPVCYLIKNRNFYMVLPLICLAGFFYNPFTMLLSLGGIPEHMQIYLNEEGGGGLVVSLIGISVMLLYLLFRDRFKDDDQIFRYYQLFALGAALNLLFIQASIFQRFTFLLFQIGVLLMPLLLTRLEAGKDKYYFFYLHVFFNCFLLYYGLKMIHPDLIRPYF